MIHEIILVRANHVTRELKVLATIEQCDTREEAEETARELNAEEDLDKDEFYMSVEREDDEDE